MGILLLPQVYIIYLKSSESLLSRDARQTFVDRLHRIVECFLAHVGQRHFESAARRDLSDSRSHDARTDDRNVLDVVQSVLGCEHFLKIMSCKASDAMDEVVAVAKLKPDISREEIGFVYQRLDEVREIASFLPTVHE